MSTINTNIGAYSAQQNLRTANAATTSSIGKLSSGNRIQRAADDVAGLSVGTILATNVSTLRKGLENAGQANSLLQVADGGLKNITNILQRQKALSVAATSGILSPAERGYLNQEFQNLTSEIDRLVDNTKFNSVKLLDGSLSKSVELETKANLSTAVGTAVVSGTIVTIATPTNNTKFSINGVVVQFTTDAIGSELAAGKVRVGANATETAENVVRFLNESTDGRLALLTFRNAAGVITAEWGGGISAGPVDLNVTNIDAGAGITVPGTVATINAAADTEFFSRGRVKAVGQFLDTNILAEADSSTGGTGTGSALTLSDSTVTVTPIGGGAAGGLGLDRTADWIGKLGEGKIGKFEAIYAGAVDTIRLQIQVGNIIYTSNVAAGQDITNAAGTETDFDFVGRDKDNTVNVIGGTFRLSLRGGIPANSVENQTEADEIAEQINAAFQNITFLQNRDVASFKPLEETVLNSQGVEILQLDDARADFRSDNFDVEPKIGGFKITAPKDGEVDAKISVKVNGEEYTSFAGLGNQLKTGSLIILQGADKNKVLTIQLGNTTLAGKTLTAADISSQENADLIAAALDKAFGFVPGSTKSDLNFQIGSVATDAIAVEIENAGSADLFNGKSLKLDTVADANAASDALDVAIARVTALRANIGALQSRFDFASANLETSIANVDAARSTFLDANISEESTNFAQAQVKLQASISVLAQANQLPQNLLKLIG